MSELRGLLCLFACLVLALPATSQRKNDPTACPYCLGDPALMEKVGVVSHGGFEFGASDTAETDKLLATSDIRWVETPHFEIGFALGPMKVKQADKARIRAELTRLSEALPDAKINPKSKVIDPWLRAHIYALRVEAIWDRFLELMRVSPEDFPTGSGQFVIGTGAKYMGEGPYLGQPGKFEILILPSQAALTTYLKEQFGLLIKMTQRWHVIPRGTLTVTIHTADGGLREDAALHGHLAFNLTINLLDGFKHYSYDTPLWIREGLGHFVERELDPDYNTFDSSEGAVADMTRKSDWTAEVKKLIAKGEAPRLAELVGLKSYAEFELRHHFATWSMVQFLVETDPEGFACLNDSLHGRMTAEGYPDGGNMEDAHREAVRDCLEMSYAAFDEAWTAWAQAR